MPNENNVYKLLSVQYALSKYNIRYSVLKESRWSHRECGAPACSSALPQFLLDT